MRYADIATTLALIVLAADLVPALAGCSSSEPAGHGGDAGVGIDAGFDAGSNDAGDASGALDASACATARCDHDCECFGLGFGGFVCFEHCCANRPQRLFGLCEPGHGSDSFCACVGGTCDGPAGTSCCRLPDGTIPDEFGAVCQPDAGGP